MMTFRILLFSTLAALLLYLPFYHFAPVYHAMYAHVPVQDVNWWIRWSFQEDNGGIQIYVAYVLMFLAIGLTAFFEYICVRFISARMHWIFLVVGAIAGIFYLHTIGFYPPMANVRIDVEGILFIVIALIITFVFGRFFDRKEIKWSLLFLLFGICMVPVWWAFFRQDYYYFFAPAVRTLRGFALNQSYFQYDHLISFLAMAWLKLGLPADRFLHIIDLSYFAFFVGAFFLARNILFDKRLAVYFVLSLVLIKIYGNMSDPTSCPQVSPLRLDLWLIVLGLAYWRGPRHWTMGLTLGFFLIFHHSFGMIYSISYLLFVFTDLVLNISQDSSTGIERIKESARRYFPNLCMMLGGMLINRIFLSSDNTIPVLNYVKYNIGFMPIDPKSFFWYVPLVISTAALLLWKNRTQLPQRYFQTGILLVLLAIGNLLYFFGRSHENNLINISAIPWLVFFMLIDLIVYNMPSKFADGVKKVWVPLAGVLIVGVIAYFYSATAVDRINRQIAILPTVADIFKPSTGIDFDFNTLKAVTRGNPNVVFLSVNDDFEYYYYGGYTPVEFCPLASQLFLFDFMYILNNRLAKGADIIVPTKDFDLMQENILLLDAQYTYRARDFVYFSNNQPANQS